MFAAKKATTKSGYVSKNVFDGIRIMDATTAKRHIASMKQQIDDAKKQRESRKRNDNHVYERV